MACHPQRSPKALFLLRFGAFHFVVNLVLALLSAGFLLFSFIVQSDIFFVLGITLVFLWIISFLVFLLLNHSWSCPICLGRLWLRTGCRRHHKATHYLGVSYRLGIAASAIMSKQYRCPYCGESFSTTKVLK